MTRRDAETLLREKRGIRQAMMSAGGGTVEPELSTLKPFSVDTRWTSADFFPMFDVPMQYGRPGTAAMMTIAAAWWCCRKRSTTSCSRVPTAPVARSA
jgi:hypothetical protein